MIAIQDVLAKFPIDPAGRTMERAGGPEGIPESSPSPRPELWETALEYFRGHRVVFDGSGGKWESTAFNLYQMMVEAATVKGPLPIPFPEAETPGNTGGEG
jgi:hypothetical protein